MEAEERPAKMQKIVHPSDDETAEIMAINDQQLEGDDESEGHNATSNDSTKSHEKRERSPLPEGMSRSAYKKMKRQVKIDASKKERKAKDKQRKKDSKARRREEAQKAEEAGTSVALTPHQALFEKRQKSVRLPVTIIIDCGYDEKMLPTEVTSLSSQITRCYSDNSKSKYRVHLAVCSFNKRLKERFDTVLDKQYKKWKGVKFLEEDFVTVAEQAKGWMAQDGKHDYSQSSFAKQNPPVEGEELQEPKGEVIYLSSDSDNVINKLEPHCTYIVGGLVDRNREKGICYKAAMNAGVKTARLPIGEFLEMNSRKVLTTNHVNEIMLHWLDLGDWGEAFIKVIPKRKGLALKGQTRDTADEDAKHGDSEKDGDDAKDSAEEDELELEPETEPEVAHDESRKLS
ncbi:tRNA m(1)G methyltransferase domain containing protein [Venturia nashicola]|uniref:tRNA (guanine(9)-N1)-methyltransferase n=1 Tax=Venturia nashicola TaxID=86259 RepID=A0A4Z1NF65_9PEZI|nr:tRNA m(1)G methyltransferase domain containing protein [Venturia nashicola]